MTRAPTRKRGTTEKSPSSDPARPSATPAFPIVAIGASAGGLEALQQFFTHVPAGSGLAFVVIQHLDPTHKGLLAEILQRSTEMPVVEIADMVRVEPEHVYVIPPNKDLSLAGGVLRLHVPAAPRGQRLPIDSFFRSLAADAAERSVGVVLSGMGTDGTAGLRAIRDAAGAAFVQTPESASCDGMPRSAIDSGLADVVARAEDLPGKILEYRAVAHRAAAPPRPDSSGDSGGSLEHVVAILRSELGHDFSQYKRSTIQRRVERRMGLLQLDEMARYVRYVRENREEAELLFRELLIGVTSFFRDPTAWEKLRRDVLPAMIEGRARGSVLRAWVPACSTGEEAYSLAMAFKEALEEAAPRKHVRVQIFATDLDPSAVERARRGSYPAHIATDVSPERLRRFFIEEDGGYRARPEIRDLVVFATQNVVQDPPFTKLDLLSCRNLLIYLTPELQKKLLPIFHYSLRPGGVLFLGSAETVGEFSDRFAEVGGKTHIYRRLEPTAGIAATAPLDFPSSFARAPERAPTLELAEAAAGAAPAASLQSLVEKYLCARFAPAAVLTTLKGDVLYVSGRTGKYLELPAGKANWNVFAMAREGLAPALLEAFPAALAAKGSVTVSGLTPTAGATRETVALTVEALSDPEALRGTVMVVFTDVATPSDEGSTRASSGSPRRSASIALLEQQLRDARAEMSSHRAEMQGSQEELKAANEELQSTNEELQSTNEELTTSKEEMQSMNEELQTLNHELQAKVDELSRTSNDMKNLLDSTEIAVLFLDEGLNVRRFTPQATSLFKLIPGDVGRPLEDLASNLAYPELYDDAREVLRSLVFKEKAAVGLEGRRFRVRIMPYRTSDNRIDGVVITFTNMSQVEAPPSARAEGVS